MLTASQPPDAPSALRVGLSAGKSLLGGLMLGALLALVLGCGAAVFYFSRLMADPGQGIHASAHTGIYGAVISLLISPPLLVAVVLIFIIPAYLMVGLQLGRAGRGGAHLLLHQWRKQPQVGEHHPIAERLGGADAVQQLPRRALQVAGKGLGSDALQGLAQASHGGFGEGLWLRAVPALRLGF